MKAQPQVAGQIPLFYPDVPEKPIVEIPYVGPGVSREEITYRAGTRLDHRWTHKIIGKGRRGQIVHGLFDESQRVYQTGGELSAFIFWKRHLVSISIDAWRRIGNVADWIEIIDHENNECWRISGVRFTKNAVRYEAGIGERIGCPMDLWTVITAAGRIKQEGRA